jgi:peroxiredoxin
MKNFSKIVIIAIGVLMGGGISNAMGQYLSLGNPMIEKPAPDFTLKSLSGQEINFQAFRSGKPAIIFFWATWCPHCREQLDELSAKSSEFETKGIKVALVDIEESRETVRAYLERRGISFDVLLDDTSAVAQDYSILGVPTYYFINKDGIVKAIEHAIPDDIEKILQ